MQIIHFDPLVKIPNDQLRVLARSTLILKLCFENFHHFMLFWEDFRKKTLFHVQLVQFVCPKCDESTNFDSFESLCNSVA